MIKRTIQLGDYDTAVHGLWTLAAWSFPEPPVVENLVDIPGRYKGPLDLSTALTDGVPTYGARSLSITLETSEGDRLAREERIAIMVNRLHGQRVNFVLPDRTRHYGTGRLSIETLYNDMAHASVQVTGVCEPWLYAKDETVVLLQAAAAAQTIQVRNAGAMPVLPLLTITGNGVSFLLQYKENSWALGPGVYELPALLLTPGDHPITYSGSGVAEIRYREAVLK
jgi:hypothetical protein